MPGAEPRHLLGGVAALALASSGPIAAPSGAVDLRDHPEALQERFDSEAGRPRLLLLLSPG